jgi:hypothetical protein
MSIGTLTLTGQPLDTETVTIDAKVYTFQTTLTDVDGNVLIGATAAASLVNLRAAINLTASGAGSLYAASMTVHPTAWVPSVTTATTIVAAAKTGGVAGDAIASTETLTNGSWGAATLENGADFPLTISTTPLLVGPFTGGAVLLSTATQSLHVRFFADGEDVVAAGLGDVLLGTVAVDGIHVIPTSAGDVMSTRSDSASATAQGSKARIG